MSKDYIEINKEEEIMEEKIGFFTKLANGAKTVWESKPVKIAGKVGIPLVSAGIGLMAGLALGGSNGSNDSDDDNFDEDIE